VIGVFLVTDTISQTFCNTVWTACNWRSSLLLIFLYE
jgi:hypothetical protein